MVVDVPLITIGGGLGSFALVDVLRVAGVPAEKIRVISPHRTPDANFLRRCRASGLGDTDRLRSDSSARIDNPWGFPGYAVQQAWQTRRVQPLLRVLTEPVLSEYYTPTVNQVHSGLRREADRIRWESMVVDGVATEIRREDGGGYLVTVEPLTGPARVYRSRFVHLAPGYAGPRLTADARRFRDRNPTDDRHAHAYEPHEHVYAALAERPGTVLVRGTGIGASRILQRLADDRRTSGSDIRVWHLCRRPPGRDPRPARLARYDSGAFICQPFNFPKAAFGGQLRDRTLRLPADERADEIRAAGRHEHPLSQALGAAAAARAGGGVVPAHCRRRDRPRADRVRDRGLRPSTGQRDGDPAGGLRHRRHRAGPGHPQAPDSRLGRQPRRDHEPARRPGCRARLRRPGRGKRGRPDLRFRVWSSPAGISRRRTRSRDCSWPPWRSPTHSLGKGWAHHCGSRARSSGWWHWMRNRPL